MPNRVAVFWDYENCRPPSTLNLPASRLVDNIRHLVQGSGIIQAFKAYVDVSLEYTNPRSLALHSDLQSSGVTLVHCPHNGKKDVADKMMLVDMFTFAFDNPSPSTIVIITGDRDFAYAAATLKLRGYEIIVIAPSNIAHSSLTTQASRLYDWQRDVAGVLKPETGTSSPECFDPATQTQEKAHSVLPSVFRAPTKYPKQDENSRPPSVYRSAKANSKFSFLAPREVQPSSEGRDKVALKSTTAAEFRRRVLKTSTNAKSPSYELVPTTQSLDIQAGACCLDPDAEEDPELEESANASFKSLVHIDSLSSGTKPRILPTFTFPFADDSDEAEDDDLEPFSKPLPLSESNVASFPHSQENCNHRKLEFGNFVAHEGTDNASDVNDEGCGCGICKRTSSAGLDGSGDDLEPYEQIDDTNSEVHPNGESPFSVIFESIETPSSIPSTPSFMESNKYMKGPNNASITRFWTLISLFIEEHARTGTKRIRSATVASEMRKRDPDVYEKAGVAKMKQYIEEARKARVIISPGLDNEGDGWIEIHDVFYPNIEQSLTIIHQPPPQNSPAKSALDANKKYSKVTYAPLIARLKAETPPHRLLYSLLGTYFAMHHPTLYARANVTGLSHYLAKAEKRGIVRIGGLDTPGRQWVELVPKLTTFTG